MLTLNMSSDCIWQSESTQEVTGDHTPLKSTGMQVVFHTSCKGTKRSPGRLEVEVLQKCVNNLQSLQKHWTGIRAKLFIASKNGWGITKPIHMLAYLPVLFVLILGLPGIQGNCFSPFIAFRLKDLILFYEQHLK
jgi:hypothetical protein